MKSPAAPIEWREGEVPHIDVRGLPPPQPLVSILRRVQSLRPDEQLVVHHDRVPVLLFPELAEIGWEAEQLAAPAGEVRLVVRRVSP